LASIVALLQNVSSLYIGRLLKKAIVFLLKRKVVFPRQKEDGTVLAIDQDSKRIMVNIDNYRDIWLSVKDFENFDALEIGDQVQIDIYGPVAESDPAKGSAKNVDIIEKEKAKVKDKETKLFNLENITFNQIDTSMDIPFQKS
jgi:hypothetical protein